MSMLRGPASRRHIPLLFGVLAAGAWLAAAMPEAGAGTTAIAAAPTAAAVDIHNFQFSPATLTVAAGTTVTWTNDDPSPHTVTESSRAFHSAALDVKETFSHTFAMPGEYVYRCTLHPMMVGRIIVKPAGSSS